MIIDLTMTLREGIMTFPVHWHPVVEITQLGRFEVEGRETRKIILGTHTGTHVDAPRHFVPNGATIENTDLDIYYGPARVLDFTHLPDKTEITREMLVERIGEDFPARILFRYDWERRLDSLKYYTDHPYLSEGASEWLAENGIRLVGFDAPMPDDPRNGRGSDRDSPNHTILLGAGVAILEYLVNLSQIPTKDFILSALPIKIKEGDGAPVRAVAIIE
ncbi:cyclase family protein [Rhizobium leguminosarum]|uniref:cyclase family protein n=2 Tax=Rhizobium ruizarguesonis TaxID=2081791 RepID=UPI00102FC174|nr:cyclase family protein [Rhizobium ruizarguesonis]NEI08752.1 cyclase family protein [Rhizobium ruizarguesonis]TBB69491.1 cyclase family protein [Rhizobium ruizarguesonis]